MHTKSQDKIILSCKEDNDLYLTLKANKIALNRYSTPEEAINNAGEGAGVMILADGYPSKTTEWMLLFLKRRVAKN